MVLSTTSPQLDQTCQSCVSPIEPGAKFCGECGAVAITNSQVPAFAQAHFYSGTPRPQTPSSLPNPQNLRPVAGNQHHRQTQSGNLHVYPGKPSSQVPRFVRMSTPADSKRVSQEVKEELAKLVMLMARERLFLYFHCTIFLCVNAFGLFLSLKAYNEYIGDEMTRVVMSMTPLMFINTIGLACLAPIKGTKREIARLKEKMRLIRHKLDYSNLF